MNLFIIAVYMPHRARINPAQHNTMTDLMHLLKEIPSNDCIVVLGDFNEQLPGSIHQLTGKWNYGDGSQNADELLNTMRMFDLFAVNTLPVFQPRRGTTNATYTFCSEGSFGPRDKSTNWVGRRVRARYKGSTVLGDITDKITRDGKTLWTVKFEDGYQIIVDLVLG